MSETRRKTLLMLTATALGKAQAQFPPNPEPRPRFPPEPDAKLPNGKSQKDAIARENHQKALTDADELVKLVEQLQDELKKAGDFVIPAASVKRTEDIEKLARRIRGRLKG